jgi:nucleoside phosphorylase
MPVDIGIITIRDDEHRALLKAFPNSSSTQRGRHREYALRTTDAGDGSIYSVAILRQVEQGNGEAQEAARDMIDDLKPALLILVGIAGGLPSDDITLGDVVLSTRIVDFSVEARKFNEATAYSVGGGPIAKQISTGIANLGARESDLGAWTEGLPSKPKVPRHFYGPNKWIARVKESVELHFGRNASSRPPLFTAGTIASSDRLIKDPKVLFPWISTARNILAIEMEAAGVHRATRDNTPMLAIRGISDIVGLKRNDAWTKYACAAAASFTRAYLRTTPIPPSPKTTAQNSSSGKTPAAAQDAAVQEAFSNLLPLRHFPERIFIAPAMVGTEAAGWAKINSVAKSKTSPRVPGTWCIFEKNIYSFLDPELSRLRNIVDVGGIDSFNTSDWSESTDDEKRRMFVRLLNRALREDLWNVGVRYHRDSKVFAFMGRPSEPPRRLTYGNLKLRSSATVVAHYETKGENGKTYKYLRHSACHTRFRRLNDAWHIEVNPTYRFTRDGKELDRFHESRLSGIKRLERNRSVVSQLLQWQATLRSPWQKADQARLLEFGPLLFFEFWSDLDETKLTALDPPTVVLDSQELQRDVV